MRSNVKPNVLGIIGLRMGYCFGILEIIFDGYLEIFSMLDFGRGVIRGV